jgi:hypothetical protein
VILSCWLLPPPATSTGGAGITALITALAVVPSLRRRPPAVLRQWINSTTPPSMMASAEEGTPARRSNGSKKNLSRDGLVTVSVFHTAPRQSRPLHSIERLAFQELLAELKHQGLVIQESSITGGGSGLFLSKDRWPALHNKPSLVYKGKVYSSAQWEERAQQLSQAVGDGTRVDGCRRFAAAAFDTVDETLSPYAVELSNGDIVDAEDSFCAARFANHSSNPEHINFLLVEGATETGRFPILHQIKEFLPAGTEVVWDYNAQLSPQLPSLKSCDDDGAAAATGNDGDGLSSPPSPSLSDSDFEPSGQSSSSSDDKDDDCDDREDSGFDDREDSDLDCNAQCAIIQFQQ